MIANGPASKIARSPNDPLVASVVGLHLLIPMREDSQLDPDRGAATYDGNSVLAIVRENEISFRRLEKGLGAVAGVSADHLSVRGKVTAKMNTARGIRLVVKVDGRSIHWRSRDSNRATEQIEPGDEVELSFKREGASIGKIGD